MDRNLFLLILSIISIHFSNAQSNSNVQVETPNDYTAKCFSCMSEVYEKIWPEIEDVYKKPKDFTDECTGSLCNAKNISPTLVRTILCPHVCVSIKEKVKFGDTYVQGYIRGCLDSILIHSFNHTIVGLYRWLEGRDSCNNYRKKALFNAPPGRFDDTSSVRTCTCFDHFCNTGILDTQDLSSFKREKGNSGTLKTKNGAMTNYDRLGFFTFPVLYIWIY